MANQRHVDILTRDGVRVWNLWRKEEPGIRPDLREARLMGANLAGADLYEADLSGADLRAAHFSQVQLREGDDSSKDRYGTHFGSLVTEAERLDFDFIMARVSLMMVNVSDYYRRNVYVKATELLAADLGGANLSGADLRAAFLRGANLEGANLRGANLSGADLGAAILVRADLSGANLTNAYLRWAEVRWANLASANLSGASCVRTDLSGADLTGCTVYGISAWDLVLDDSTIQTDLCIAPHGELPAITVDNLEVAQFLYVLLHNSKVRAVLDTITSRVVLILGRFSAERKPVLDALREALRHQSTGYVPVLFDFEPQRDKPVLETVKTLANLARFVIADLTDPRMVRSELTYIIPNVPTVPVQSIIEGDSGLPPEYETWALYKSFLPVYRYADPSRLLASLTESVITPVEQHVHARRLADA